MSLQLTPAQLAEYDKNGFLLLPAVLSPAEVALLAAEAANVYSMQRPEIVRERSGAPRSAFGAHKYNAAFGVLARDPRIVGPVEQILGERCYMHQFKINAKEKFTGDLWQWHQDFGVWSRDDGMPEPKAINIAIFLDPVLPINGPLMVIPRSHTVGVLPADYDKGTTSYGIWSLKEDDITRLANEGGIEAPTGPAGSVLLFHGNIVHGSAPNITPYPRKIVYLTLNPVSNYLRKPTRPIWQGERDSTPIVCCDAGELAKLAAAGGQARL